MLEKIDLNNLDKSNWETFRFEEIAAKISETVLPEVAEVDIYIGLEHIDIEDIHIRRRGVPADVKGGKLRCYPGDVIFGKRRAYQRKAAIVDFDGICSAHAFVFRANKDVIDPKLFPFFLHSDQFMYRMIDISVGGLSPTINWGDLKHEEFLLPPKEEQANLAELLWAMDEVIESDIHIYEKITTLIKSIQLNIYKNYNKIKLQDEYSLLAGYAFKSKDFSSTGMPVVKIKDIKEINNSVDTDDISDFIPFNDKYKKYLIKHGDLLVGLTGSKSGGGYVGKLGEIADIDREFLLNQRVAKLISKLNNSNPLTKLLITSPYFLNNVWIRCNEGAQANISTKDLNKCLIPDLSVEKRYYNELSFKIYASLEVIEKRLKLSRDLQKSLINQIF